MTKNPVFATLLAVFLFCPLPAGAAESGPAFPKVKLEKVIQKMEIPVYLLHDPAGRIFVVEKKGRVRLLGPDLQPDPTLYLDISKEVWSTDNECGLLSIAFHPKFAQNGLIYVNYNAKRPNLKTIIAEFKADPKSNTVDPSTERVILTIDQPFGNHKGGQIQFGPDGMLYIGMGDGGSAHDPHKNGQNPRSLLGKILRIDVAPRDGYGVPKDNPFVGDEKYAPEIWALGMRNPWRFSFDEPTGLLYAGDVGQDIWEEIDVIEKGKNYGWNVREGFHDLHPIDNPPPFAEPIFEYEHGTKAKRFPASVTGGYVYRGKKIPALVGCYIFADYVDGRVWAIRYEGGKVTASDVIVDPKNPDKNGGQRPTQPSSFGVGPDGELYMLDGNGPVYRLAPVE